MSRRKFAAFAAITFALPVMVMTAGLFAADLFLHKRAERSAGMNVWGYRGPLARAKQPGELRLAMLGGSTVFGYGLPWFEAPPAVLERKLNERHQGRPRISVVNLGFNNEGAYAYKYTLDDFAFLDYDVAVMYDAYNDMMGDAGPNTALYRHRSAVFRLTGYYPILPLVLHEKAMSIVSGGNLNAAYAASRGEAEGKTVFQPNLAQRTSAATLEAAASITEALGRQLGRLSAAPQPPLPDTAEAGCASPWSHYCQSMYAAVTHGLELGKKVIVVLQPRLVGLVEDAHRGQQAALVDMLGRKFGDHPRLRIVDISDAIDLNDRNYAFDNVHLSTDGTERVVAILAERLDPFLR